ncbi:MAG TPA: class I SAM-dependent methyltransferase [Polyangiaceae bacterium]|nr:class I SAM-dependent methyltransferase [Polyangiaceae bacterium]
MSDALIRAARFHGAVTTERFATEGEYCLYLMHRRAYLEARALAAGKRVLDLGCNVGYGTELLSETASQVVGVDLSPAVVAAARKRVHAPNVEFRLLPDPRLPFPDGSFELVASFQVIEHVPEPASYLAEIRRVLVPGGHAIFTTPNAAIRIDPGMTPWNVDHVKEYRARELEPLLRRYFSDVSLKGLFASEPLHSVEVARCAAARAKARKKVRAWVSRRARIALGANRVDQLRGLANALRRIERRAPDLTRFSIEDIFYRTESLDESLDLLAVCRV